MEAEKIARKETERYVGNTKDEISEYRVTIQRMSEEIKEAKKGIAK